MSVQSCKTQLTMWIEQISPDPEGYVVVDGMMPCEVCANPTRVRSPRTGLPFCINCTTYLRLLRTVVWKLWAPPGRKVPASRKASTVTGVVCRGGPRNGQFIRRASSMGAGKAKQMVTWNVLGLMGDPRQADLYMYDALEDCMQHLNERPVIR